MQWRLHKKHGVTFLDVFVSWHVTSSISQVVEMICGILCFCVCVLAELFWIFLDKLEVKSEIFSSLQLLYMVSGVDLTVR